jgi:hypothetical protein
MDALIKFMLTQWAGAPLAIWFLGVLAVLVMFTIGVSKRISVTTPRGGIALEKNSPARKRTKQVPPENPPRPK